MFCQKKYANIAELPNAGFVACMHIMSYGVAGIISGYGILMILCLYIWRQNGIQKKSAHTQTIASICVRDVFFL